MTSRRLFPLFLCLIVYLLGSTALVNADCAPAPSGGNDTIDCTDTDPDGVDAGAGNDSIHIEPTAVVGNESTDEVNGGDGDDTITNDGTITGSVDGGAGNDSLTNTSSGEINGDFEGGSGNDEITNAGTVNGDVNGGDGTFDFITNTGIVNGDVNGNNGRDEIDNVGGQI